MLQNSKRLFVSVCKYIFVRGFIAALGVLICVSGSAQAQSALDGFDPNATAFTDVQAVAVQPDGKIIIGGNFNTLKPNGAANPTPRNRIARLNPDGNLDMSFDPNANAAVSVITIQSDGKILIGGNFSALQPNGAVNPTTRNRIARLNSDGTLDMTFDPNADFDVNTIVVQSDGKILIGGSFTSLKPNGAANSTTRNHLARLNSDGTLDMTFDPNANNFTGSIAVQSDGKILVGGQFTTLQPNGAANSTTRNNIARLNTDGTIDMTFNPNANSAVSKIAVQADGKILVGGFFSTLQPNGAANPTTRNRIARLNSDGTLDITFDPNAAVGGVFSIAIQADGKILIGGGFTTLQPNGAANPTTRNRIARLNPDGTLDTVFNPNADDTVSSIAVQSDGKILIVGSFTTLQPNGAANSTTRNEIARLETDGRLDQTANINAVGCCIFSAAVQYDGKILIGGNFSSIGGQTRNRIARLNTDGTVDTAFNPNADFNANAIAVQSDGKILVGGKFTNIAGQTRNRIARLNADGTADMTFNPNADDGVNGIVVQSDGKIIVSGDFTVIGGQTRNHIARLNADGTVDMSFNPNPNATVNTVALQFDGKILVGGGFTMIGGQARSVLARLNTDGTVDLSFNANGDISVDSIAVQLDGKILVGGNFSLIGGQARARVARLNSDGTADMTFNPGASADITSIVLQTDGKILAGGLFTMIGGQTRNRIARLNTDGTVDAAFNPNADSDVNAIVLQADGKVLAGGSFTTIGGQSRNLFARLSNGTAAVQTLSATSTTITWTRNGAGPLLSRVTFEQSTDGVNYALLGSGTSSASAPQIWTLTGQNLPGGQNLYIRARGFYHGGFVNGSESMTELIQNIFLPAPTGADLSITKTDGVTTATPGGSVIYTIVASNSGPLAATGATVADTFPASLTAAWTCAGAGGGTCTAAGSGNISDTVDLPAGASVTYTVSAAISPAATGTLSNTATVTAPAGLTDPTPGNNSATDSDMLAPQADLSITKTDGVTTATAGGTVTYTITASNSGPSNAAGATAADTFPAVLTGVTWSCAGAGGGTCTAAGAGNINDMVNLPAGGSVTYTVSAILSPAAMGMLSNTATVTAPAGVTDPVPGNNSATDTDTIVANADLSVTKSDGPDPVTAGNNIAYAINVSNSGPAGAAAATLIDNIPASTTFQSIAVPAGWSCTTPAVNSTGTVSCTNALLANGAAGAFVLVVNVNTGTINGTITNTASVSSSNPDPVAGNNTATTTTTVAEFVSPAPTGQAPKALLVKPAAGNMTAGGGVSDSSCAAPAGVTVAGVFADINQALGAANTGDTIYVCPKYTGGLVVPYIEQISLGFTNLSVVGISDVKGSRAVIAANPSTPASSTTQPGTNYIVQIAATGVNFGNFVIDGAPGGINFANTGIFNGIVVRRSGAFVFNNTVQNIKTSDTAANANGQAIAVFGAGSAGSPIEAGTIANPVNILNNIVQTYRSNGVNVSAGSSSAYAFVRGNYIIGNGANPGTVNQAGVEFLSGANGDVFNNRITGILDNNGGCSATAFSDCSAGVRLNTTASSSANNLRVRFNQISNTQTGIFAQDVQYVSMTSNTISNSVIDGINLRGSLFTLGSNFSTINQNTILASRRAGIFIGLVGGDASLGNNLTQNTIEDAFTGVANNPPVGNNTISTSGATANTFISVNNFVGSASSGVNNVQNTNPLP